MKLVQAPSLIVAALLQLLPITRAAVPLVQGSSNVIAIVIRWAGAVTAALGGVHAVAGASTVITSSLKATGKQGQLFSLRLTTAPDQAHYWTATGLPDAIKLTGTSGASLWKLEGIPNVAGVFNIKLTAKDKISSGADRTVSGTLVLTISASATAPSITTQPQDLTLLAGQDGALSVTATGSAPLNYRWRLGAQAVANATNSTLTLSQVSEAVAGNYDVIVSNTAGSVTSRVAVVTVQVPSTPPTITGEPQDLTLLAGQDGALSVTATGSAPLNYQWRLGAQAVENATNSTLTLTQVTEAAAGNYDVIVSNTSGSVTSRVAVVTVQVPPSITTQPQSLVLLSGQQGNLSVIAIGTGPLSYQWRLGAQALADATNATLSLTQVGDYDVVVANSVGSVTSQVARVTLEQPLTITVTPATGGSGPIMSFQAAAGVSYAVMATDDLTNGIWVKIQDIAAGLEPIVQNIVDPQGTQGAQRFYRVVSQ